MKKIFQGRICLPHILKLEKRTDYLNGLKKLNLNLRKYFMVFILKIK